MNSCSRVNWKQNVCPKIMSLFEKCPSLAAPACCLRLSYPRSNNGDVWEKLQQQVSRIPNGSSLRHVCPEHEQTSGQLTLSRTDERQNLGTGHGRKRSQHHWYTCIFNYIKANIEKMQHCIDSPFFARCNSNLRPPRRFLCRPRLEPGLRGKEGGPDPILVHNPGDVV